MNRKERARRDAAQHRQDLERNTQTELVKLSKRFDAAWTTGLDDGERGVNESTLTGYYDMFDRWIREVWRQGHAEGAKKHAAYVAKLRDELAIDGHCPWPPPTRPAPPDAALKPGAIWQRVRLNGTERVTRFEVIDSTGRAYVVNNASIWCRLQDGQRTLKVFVDDLPQPTMPTPDQP